MVTDLKFGITEGGVLHTDRDPPIDLDTRFRMVAEAGVFDYYDKTPESIDQEAAYQAASEKYGLPIRAGGWFYTLGRDEDLLRQKLASSARLGARVHNTQIRTEHASGRPVSNDEVTDIYLRAYEWGQRCGCMPSFEVHINMWSEDFRRVEQVADQVERHGIPFHMTLDHSHVIFKIDNPAEQEIGDIRGDVESGALVLDPFKPDSICQRWIERGLVLHCHARAAVPANPVNTWGQHPDGSVGRGVQYPFIEPAPGQYLAPWDERRLEPWKEVVRQLLDYHATHEHSVLGQISTEFIPNPDYGAGHGYSIFENSVACAHWLRETWANAQQAAKAEPATGA